MDRSAQNPEDLMIDNDDKIFFIKYPYPFLQYWYGIFPLAQEETTPSVTHRQVNCFFLIC
jgi:hypothetical protein